MLLRVCSPLETLPLNDAQLYDIFEHNAMYACLLKKECPLPVTPIVGRPVVYYKPALFGSVSKAILRYHKTNETSKRPTNNRVFVLSHRSCTRHATRRSTSRTSSGRRAARAWRWGLRMARFTCTSECLRSLLASPGL